MEAAITAALRGHDVTLVEKSGELGGNLHPAGAAYFKEDIRKLCKVLISRVEKAGVKVVLNTEVTPEYVKHLTRMHYLWQLDRMNCARRSKVWICHM